MAEPLRHRQTKGAANRHARPKATAPHSYSTIALVVTPNGLPLAYQVLPGNTADSKTLRSFLARIESQYGKARRVWVMDSSVFSR